MEKTLKMNPERATIMIVDDTPANLTLLQEILQLQGYRVLVFTRGSMALKAAEKNPPDLILLDITMPEMDGFEVCRNLKNNEILKNIPVLFISALTSEADRLQAFHEGELDFVTKPFYFEEIRARVETHLRLYQMQKDIDIPLSARIMAVSDVYDALRSERPYKESFTHERSYDIIMNSTGVDFDPIVIDVFKECEKEFSDIHENYKNL